jgi:transposase
LTVRRVLVEAAHAAAHTKNTYLSAQYRRLAARLGKKKALIAVAHSLLVIVYHRLTEDQGYQELGGNYFDERDRQAVQRRLVRRLEQLGYHVTLEVAGPAA